MVYLSLGPIGNAAGYCVQLSFFCTDCGLSVAKMRLCPSVTGWHAALMCIVNMNSTTNSQILRTHEIRSVGTIDPN